MSRSISQALAAWLAAGETRIGELAILGRYEVRHHLDCGLEGLALHSTPEAAYEIALYDEAGIYRPLDDALRIAFRELVAWIHTDYGMSELDAYELLSKVAKIHLNEMVDPNYVVVASIEKKYLPAKKK